MEPEAPVTSALGGRSMLWDTTSLRTASPVPDGQEPESKQCHASCRPHVSVEPQNCSPYALQPHASAAEVSDCPKSDRVQVLQQSASGELHGKLLEGWRAAWEEQIGLNSERALTAGALGIEVTPESAVSPGDMLPE
jgi:hypothetical protein